MGLFYHRGKKFNNIGAILIDSDYIWGYTVLGYIERIFILYC